MTTKGVPGIPLAAMAAGGVLVWSGIQNRSITDTLTSLLKGTQPTPGPAATLVSATGSTAATAPAGNTTAGTANAALNQNIARLLAAPYGWSTGQQWADLVSLWNKESGWSATADNSGSGAYGIAQALPPTKYPAAAQAPPIGNSSASAQISWGLEYIKETYGSPSAAWAHEVANNWY
jgi:hypothetical protein